MLHSEPKSLPNTVKTSSDMSQLGTRSLVMAVFLPPPLPDLVKVKTVSEVECDTGRIRITLAVKRESAVVSIVLTTFLKFLTISERLTCLVAVAEVQIRRKRYQGKR